MATKLNVSLEQHLQDALTAIQPMLPEETSQQLTPYLSSETHTTTLRVIPYELISKISKWCQTKDGKTTLRACSPPLDPQSYTIVSLLAGTRTSPEKRFPPYIAYDPQEAQRLRTKDRKAIATLVNAVLSVIGTGVAAWWASEYTGLRLEWRTLLAVFAALVVAFAEIVLYIIWDSRQPVRKHVVRHRNKAAESASDSDSTSPRASSTAIGDNILRRRIATATELFE